MADHVDPTDVPEIVAAAEAIVQASDLSGVCQHCLAAFLLRGAVTAMWNAGVMPHQAFGMMASIINEVYGDDTVEVSHIAGHGGGGHKVH